MSELTPPIIEPLTVDDARERGLGEMLSTAEADGIGDDVFIRTIGHVDGYAEALHGAMQLARDAGSVDRTLKEIIRIQLAHTAEDPYFAGLRSRSATAVGLTEERILAGVNRFEDDDQFTTAEKWALRYAYLMYRAPDQVDSAFYDEGRLHYSDAEIVELGALIALNYGMQLFMRTLCVEPPVERPKPR